MGAPERGLHPRPQRAARGASRVSCSGTGSSRCSSRRRSCCSACGSSIRRSPRSSAASSTAAATTSSGSTTTGRSSPTRHLLTAIKNNSLWVAVVPALVDRDRADLRGADRADPVVGRVQRRRVHADGDLALRRRRDLAAHVREGSRAGHGERLDRGRAQRRVSRRACSRTRCPPAETGDRRHAGRLGAEHPAPGGERGADRADRHPASSMPRPPSRRSCPSRVRAASPASCGETSSPAAATPGPGRARGARHSRRHLELRDESGGRTQTTTDRGRRHLRVRRRRQRQLPASRSRPRPSRSPSAGVSWLGPTLITPAIMMAYIWVWAGFAMVVIAAGPRRDPARRARGGPHRRRHRVAGVPASHGAAARARAHRRLHHDADQRAEGVRHRDLDRPGSSQDDANVIALAMWRTSFGGVNDFGLGVGDRRVPASCS